MFQISKIEHTLRVPPKDLSLPLLDAVKIQIQEHFYDKVIPDLGLVITLYDVLSIEGGFVFPGDGAPTYTVEFRLVVFRPFIGEVLVGKLRRCDKSGLYLSLGFFDDIFVPEHLLQQPSKFDEKEQLWVWLYGSEGDGEDNSQFVLDLESEVRFRVEQLKFPPIPVEQEANAKPFAPMEIIATTNAPGLGLTSWW